MTRLLPLLACLTGAVALTACGDPLVVLGDAPAYMRVVAGTPDSAGRELDPIATRSRLTTPAAIAFDEQDALLYIADRGASWTVQGTTRQVARIVAVSSDGTLTLLLDQGGCATGVCLIEPRQMTPAGDGTLLIADALGHRILRFDPAARALSVLAGTGVAGTSPDGTAAAQARLDTPAGVAAGDDGTIYISEMGAGAVRRLSGGVLGTVTQVNSPSSLAWHAGSLYVSQSTEHRVVQVPAAGGTPIVVAGTGFSGFSGDDGAAVEARLDRPRGLAVTPDGSTLYVADEGNHRIRAVNLATGRIRTFAGTGSTAFAGTRLPAGVASLAGPTELAASQRAFLFIADTGHQVVWRATLGL